MQNIPRRVIYKGKKYFIQSTGRYYQDGRHNVPERLLHRRIWIDSFGNIPEGMCVHHKDGDWTNNEIDNLEIVGASKHTADHMHKHWSDPKFRARQLKAWTAKGIAAAPVWHHSPEGKAWHRQNMLNRWKTKQKETATCTECGKKFRKHFASRGKYHFCSMRCRNRSDRKRAYSDLRTCTICNVEFVAFKYGTTRTCSRHCAAILVGRIKRLARQTEKVY